MSLVIDDPTPEHRSDCDCDGCDDLWLEADDQFRRAQDRDGEDVGVVDTGTYSDEDGRCCALPEGDGHEGPCAYVCSECGGSTYCWACGGPSGDDLGTGCGECDGTGHCFYCHEGMVIAG